MTAPQMNITEIGTSAREASGFIGLGGTRDCPLLTIYFGVTAQHPSRSQAEQIAQRILQHPEIFGGAA